MKKILFSVAASGLLLSGCSTSDKNTEEKSMTKTKQDKNGYTYEYVEGDPMQVRLYTLDNGLKVYLSENHAEPRIQTLVSVKAGSTYDPKETTGLAHYLEHMMFKGTSDLGTTNWEKEKVLLQQISDLYEEHKATSDPAEKKAIYAKIDSVSQEASKYAIPNEYDKVVSSLGARGTNAYTSNEETVYINDIPANELARWVKLERERFGELVLRLFHTELETVYEEFNRGQDNDFRKSYQALMDNLFPTHPYGQQTTIGEAEHLKNPSMVNINNYWNTYYRANNMAIVLAGDLDPAETIKMIDESWSDLETNETLTAPDLPKEEPITAPVEVEVVGPDAEFLQMAFRFDGIASKDEKYVTILSNLLSNRTAGLIDLNLVQQQKVLAASAYSNFQKDYGWLSFYAKAREGQDLQEVRDLILGEIERVQKGEFEDWLMEAIINDLRLREIQKAEENYRAYFINEAFLRELPWENRVNFLEELKTVTKEELVAFTKKNLNNNYVAVYKRTGKDTNLVKVEKPQITPIEINREDQSPFYQEIMAQEPMDMEPMFLNYEEQLAQESLKDGLNMYYIENPVNELFQVSFIVDMGKNHDPNIPLAFDYLNYLGTQNMSPEDVKKEFFKLGIKFSTYTSNDRCYITIRGLEGSAKQAIELVEKLVHNAKADEESYQKFVQGVMKKRSDNKISKNAIKYEGLYTYLKHGKNNPVNHDISNEEMQNLDPNTLTQLIDDIFNYKHLVFYYGQNDKAKAKEMITSLHKTPETLLEPTPPIDFGYLASEENNIFLVNYDMVQADVIMVSKQGMFDPKKMPMANLFNEFYGRGLSSIVFQEIRESKGLAYSAYASYTSPRDEKEPHYVMAFVGTQPDKLKEAMSEMFTLMTEMPEAEKQFELAKEAILSKLESQRVIKSSVFWNYLTAKDRGLDYDIRKDIYEQVKEASMEDMKTFFENEVKGNEFNIGILANVNDIDQNMLSQMGNVRVLTTDDLFPY